MAADSTIGEERVTNVDGGRRTSPDIERGTLRRGIPGESAVGDRQAVVIGIDGSAVEGRAVSGKRTVGNRNDPVISDVDCATIGGAVAGEGTATDVDCPTSLNGAAAIHGCIAGKRGVDDRET